MRSESTRFPILFSKISAERCCQLRDFPGNWTSFDKASREKFGSRGLRFFGLFFVIPLRYLGLVFGVTTRVKV